MSEGLEPRWTRRDFGALVALAGAALVLSDCGGGEEATASPTGPVAGGEANSVSSPVTFEMPSLHIVQGESMSIAAYLPDADRDAWLLAVEGGLPAGVRFDPVTKSFYAAVDAAVGTSEAIVLTGAPRA